jgi:NAD(P)-dependent dehydrogenase (short-subunit alcohol dehydrogenase family)
MTKLKEVEGKTNKFLSGKTAIVTGASSGIGHAAALTLAQAGAAVVLFARRKDRLTKLVTDIQAQGGRACAVAGDAGSATGIDKLLKRTLDWKEGGGKFDIIVVNAGRGLAGSTLLSDNSQWQELYQTNVIGAAYLMRQAGRYMKEGKKERRHCCDWFCCGPKHIALQRVLWLQ